LASEGERFREVSLVGGVERQIGIEPGTRIDARRGLDDGSGTAEEAVCLIEPPLVADLKRKFHER